MGEFFGHELIFGASGEAKEPRRYGIVSAEEDRVTFLATFLSGDVELIPARLQTARVEDNWEFVIKAMLIDLHKMNDVGNSFEK